MTELIVTPAVNSSPTLSVTDEATRLKVQLLEKALPVLAILNEQARDYAITVAGNIKAHLKDVEASRVEVKKPFLRTSQEIDAVAKKHVAELAAELRRINTLVGDFEVERERSLQAQRQAVIDEGKRLDDASGIENDDNVRDLAATLDAEERLQGAEARLAAARVAAEAQRPTGGALRKDWEIEITDIKALYAAHPQCVELSARHLAIKDLLKAGITPAGVRATPKAAYNARATVRKLQ